MVAKWLLPKFSCKSILSHVYSISAAIQQFNIGEPGESTGRIACDR